MSSKVSRSAVVVALASLALVAACSSSSSTGAGPSGKVTPRPVASWPDSPGDALPTSYDSIAGYKQAVEDSTKPVTWNGPTVKVPVAKTGNLAAITCTAALIGCHLGADEAVAAVKRLVCTGQVTSVDNPADTDQAVQTAIINGATAILIQGIDQRLMPIGLKQAKAKGIPVVSTFQENQPLPTGVDYEINPNATAMGQLLADAIIANNNGTAHVLFLDDNEYGLPVAILKVVRTQLDACKVCHITYAKPINFTGNTVNTTFPTRVVAALRGDPKINSMVMGYDPPATFLVPAIKAAGLQNQAQLYSQLGDTLHFLKSGDVFSNDIGASLAWAGWAALDEIFRYQANQPFVLENVPYRMFTKDNVPADEKPYDGRDAGFEEKYLDLWGRAGS